MTPRPTLSCRLWLCLPLLTGLSGTRASAQCAYTEGQDFVPWDGTTEFGNAVFADATWLFVGADDDDVPFMDIGSVFVFERTGPLRQKLQASDGAKDDHFGIALDGSGSLVAVGAYGDESVRGSVYIFAYDGAAWRETAKVEPSDLGPGDYFGSSVSLDGDVLAAGAFQADAVYVFRQNGSTWIQEQKLVGTGVSPGDWFGVSVSLDGPVLAVGAPVYGGQGEGAVYVYRYDGSSWVEEAILSTGTSASANLGFSVAIDDDLIVGGAPADDITYFDDVGTGYVFRYVQGQWTPEARLVPVGGLRDGGAGFAVDLQQGPGGATAALGAPNLDPGQVHLFRETGNGWVQQAVILSEEAYFYNTALAEDVDLVGQDVFLTGAWDTRYKSGIVFQSTEPSLLLEVTPPVAKSGDIVSVRTCGGMPGGPVVLYLTEVNSTSVHIPLLPGRFDASGEWNLHGRLPKGPSRMLDLTLQSFGTYRPGMLLPTNEQDLLLR